MTAREWVERRTLDDRCLHELFARQAARAPANVALTCGDEHLTYGELDARSAALAGRLVALGAGPEVRIGLMLDPSIDLIVALLAILRAGAAYVPLDPDAPGSRIDFIVADSAISIVVTSAARADALAGRVHDVVTVENALAQPPADALPLADPVPTQLAYVIYTSGSTGKPKGVLVEHRSVVSLMRGTRTLFTFDATDVWTLFHSIAFDFSVWELWGALVYGGRLVIVPRAVARATGDFVALVARERVTVLNQTPSAFAEFVRAEGELRGTLGPLGLRYVVFGGEALPPRMLRPWVEAYGDARPMLINMYGITETTVHVTFRRITADDVAEDRGSPIGRPLLGLSIRLVGADGQRVPLGEPGEILVSGAGVARGYHARPELTAARFVDDPDGPTGHRRLYRSGDLARELPDGTFEYLGRADRQVKIRGFRIEPGEIEAVLERHPGVHQCAVAPRDDGPGGARLIAWWIPRPGVTVDAKALRAHVAASLPAYMVPSAFVPVEHWPLTINGKLDHAALPAPGSARPALAAPWKAPAEGLETALADVWSDLLGVTPVGADDDFFALGGHSLLAARLVARVQAITGRRLQPSAVFHAPTVARLAAAIESAALADPPVSHAPSSTTGAASATGGPLATAQEGLWLLERFPAARSAYLLPRAWHVEGAFDQARLAAALADVVARHEPLRTRITLIDGVPVRTVDPPGPVAIAHDDLAARSPADADAAADELVRNEAVQPFDLGREWPVRARLISLASARHLLVINVHHIASDGWSEGILWRDLAAAWTARGGDQPARFAPLPITYGEHAVRERAALRTREAHLTAWWRTALEGVPALELPIDQRRSPDFSYRGDDVAVVLDAGRVERLQSLARAHGATLQMLLLAAFQVLVGRQAGQTDFAVGVPHAGRHEHDLDDLVGLFVNTLPVRADLSGDPPFVALLERVRAASLAAYDHAALPFANIVRALGRERETSRAPVIQTFFQLMSFDARDLALDGLAVRPLPERAQRVRCDLEMTLALEDGVVRGKAIFAADLFTRAAIEALVAQYDALLAAVAERPDARIGELAAASAPDRQRQLEAWSGIADVAGDTTPVHVRFAMHAARHPDAVATVERGVATTYGALEQRADRLAARLVARAEGCGLVALRLERTTDLVVAMLAVLKAGGAYLPLDPAFPTARQRAILGDAEADLLVRLAADDGALDDLAAGTLVLDAPGASDATGGARSVAISVAVQPEDPAYVMYTSGSSGGPKGVRIPHRAISRLVGTTDYIRFTPDDRIAQASNAGFDAATFEIWGALANGATLVFVERDTLLDPQVLAAALRRDRITTMFVTSALFREVIARRPDAFGTLDWLLVGGEVVDPLRVREMMDAGPPGQFVHVYGPTENTTFSTAWPVPRDVDGTRPLPLGRPIRGSTCHVLDAAGRLLPTGAVGEICVGGTGVALGYVDRPALDAERFVPDPFMPGALIYRTGDLGRWTPDGLLHFLGRRDQQVKLRGFRIEPGEIESALATHPVVAACAVTVETDAAGDKRLAAWWVARPGGTVDQRALRTHLSERLPGFMVPARITQVDTLPLTPNGKLDTARLTAANPPDDVVADDAGEPRTPLETALAGLWSEMLGVPRVGRHDDFFALGGWSLLAVRMLARVESSLGMRTEVADVFRHPTIAGLASRLVPLENGMPDQLVETLRAGGDRPPLWFPPGILGRSGVWPELMEALPADQPIHALHALPWPAGAAPDVHTAAEAYCAHLVARQPSGPVCLAGYSFAGLLAYEMARILEAQGRDVRFVGIIDTGPDAGRDGVPTMGPATRVLRIAANFPRWAASIAATLADQDGAATIRRWTRHAFNRARSALGGRDFRGRSEDIFDVDGWSPAMRAQVDGAIAASRTYRFQPYDGRVTVFRARTRPLGHALLPDLGWRHFARGGVRVVDVPGDHRSMQRAPRVTEFARRFAEALASELARDDASRKPAPAGDQPAPTMSRISSP